MKAKFLDLRNCYRLLPPGGGLRLVERLDDCLQDINSQSRHIDTLIEQNERSLNRAVGSARLISSPLDIAQQAILESRTVRTQAVTRPLPSPAQYHSVLGYKNGMVNKRIVPLQFLLKGWGDADSGFQGYVHTISENIAPKLSGPDLLKAIQNDSESYYYVGITGRNWLLRLEEHVREMDNGSPRLFYRMWRERFGSSGVLFTSYLHEINLTYQQAMDWEEAKVDEIASDEFGLNMIPGGFKGLRLLHESRLINNMAISLEERDHAIAEYCRQNPRKGLPNPFIKALWQSDEFYLKIIAAKEKTLSVDQVKRIRTLHKQGNPVPFIANEVGALNEQQVRKVISGRTYRRIE